MTPKVTPNGTPLGRPDERKRKETIGLASFSTIRGCHFGIHFGGTFGTTSGIPLFRNNPGFNDSQKRFPKEMTPISDEILAGARIN